MRVAETIGIVHLWPTPRCKKHGAATHNALAVHSGRSHSVIKIGLLSSPPIVHGKAPSSTV
jgi:hypothetical protein